MCNFTYYVYLPFTYSFHRVPLLHQKFPSSFSSLPSSVNFFATLLPSYALILHAAFSFLFLDHLPQTLVPTLHFLLHSPFLLLLCVILASCTVGKQPCFGTTLWTDTAFSYCQSLYLDFFFSLAFYSLGSHRLSGGKSSCLFQRGMQRTCLLHKHVCLRAQAFLGSFQFVFC